MELKYPTREKTLREKISDKWESIKEAFNPTYTQPQHEWTSQETLHALVNNGVMIERARRAQRSLTGKEMSIIKAVRDVASQIGISRQTINWYEMEGIFGRERVDEPVVVKFRFAFWNPAYPGFPPTPDFQITKSNHPAFPVGGNVGLDDIKGSGLDLPSYPSFEKWVSDGRRCYRG